MKRIFRFRAVKVMPFNINEMRENAKDIVLKNYCEGIFCCGHKPNILITKVYKNGKLM